MICLYKDARKSVWSLKASYKCLQFFNYHVEAAILALGKSDALIEIFVKLVEFSAVVFPSGVSITVGSRHITIAVAFLEIVNNVK